MIRIVLLILVAVFISACNTINHSKINLKIASEISQSIDETNTCSKLCHEHRYEVYRASCVLVILEPGFQSKQLTSNFKGIFQRTEAIYL